MTTIPPVNTTSASMTSKRTKPPLSGRFMDPAQALNAIHREGGRVIASGQLQGRPAGRPIRMEIDPRVIAFDLNAVGKMPPGSPSSGNPHKIDVHTGIAPEEPVNVFSRHKLHAIVDPLQDGPFTREMKELKQIFSGPIGAQGIQRAMKKSGGEAGQQ